MRGVALRSETCRGSVDDGREGADRYAAAEHWHLAQRVGPAHRYTHGVEGGEAMAVVARGEPSIAFTATA